MKPLTMADLKFAWSHTEAMNVLRDLTPIAHRSGYLLAWYGSTANSGYGRDVDLIAVPWRLGAEPAGLLDAIERASPFRLSPGDYRGVMRTLAVVLTGPDGRVVDLQIREAEPTR